MAYQKPGGGGVASDEVNATLANVLAGKTALTSDSNDEVGTGTLPLASVLEDNGGTMPNNGATGGSIGVNGSYSIPEGYTSGGTVSQNIPTHGDSGNAAIGFGGIKSYPAGYYDNAHGAYTNITDRRGWTGGVGVGGVTYVPEGYHNGGGYVYGPSDGNLVASNIRTGKSIFGVWGSGCYVTTQINYSDTYKTGDTDLGIGVTAKYLRVNPGITPVFMLHYDYKYADNYMFRNGDAGNCICMRSDGRGSFGFYANWAEKGLAWQSNAVDVISERYYGPYFTGFCYVVGY